MCWAVAPPRSRSGQLFNFQLSEQSKLRGCWLSCIQNSTGGVAIKFKPISRSRSAIAQAFALHSERSTFHLTVTKQILRSGFSSFLLNLAPSSATSPYNIQRAIPNLINFITFINSTTFLIAHHHFTLRLSSSLPAPQTLHPVDRLSTRRARLKTTWK